jgi:adenine-specific DNA-methyltransferase
VLENLRAAGVHQSEKRDTIRFTALSPWPGEYVGAEGRFMEGETERRAAIFIGPEFGTLSRVDLVAAAREAMDARFDALIACAFAFDAHASEVSKLGPLPILKAKMNPDLHMAGDLKNTGKGNLFVVFGEPDIDIEHESDGRIKVRVKGVDVYDPNTGEIRSNDTKGIAACSSTPPTTKRASSSATPISSARTTPTGASRRRCAPISTRRPGPRSTAPSPAPLRGPRRARSR